MLRSVPLGKYWRSSPLVFSLVPRCHGLCGSGEVDPHVQGRADLLVQGEFAALVPGRGVAQEFGQVAHLGIRNVHDCHAMRPPHGRSTGSGVDSSKCLRAQ